MPEQSLQQNNDDLINASNWSNLDTTDDIDVVFQQSFEDFIWDTSKPSTDLSNSQNEMKIVDNTQNDGFSDVNNLNWNTAGVKTWGQKPLLNKWFLAWLITYIVLLIVFKVWNWWIKVWHATVLNILLFVFLIAWVVYLVKYNKFSELNVKWFWDYNENRLWRIVKNYYAWIFVFAIFFTVRMFFNNVWWHKFYKNFDKDYLENRYYEIQNEYAGCNCFWPNATQSYEWADSDYFIKNVANKYEFEFLIQTMVNLIWWKYQDEIKNTIYDNINSKLWKKCLGYWSETCDFSEYSPDEIAQIFTWAANMISSEQLQQWWLK